jgi:hypothetical protein
MGAVVVGLAMPILCQKASASKMLLLVGSRVERGGGRPNHHHHVVFLHQEAVQTTNFVVDLASIQVLLRTSDGRRLRTCGSAVVALRGALPACRYAAVWPENRPESVYFKRTQESGDDALVDALQREGGAAVVVDRCADDAEERFPNADHHLHDFFFASCDAFEALSDAVCQVVRCGCA